MGTRLRPAVVTCAWAIGLCLVLIACSPSPSGPSPSTTTWLAAPSPGASLDPPLLLALGAAPAPSAAIQERVDLVRQIGDFAYIVATPMARGGGEGDIVIAVRDSAGWHVIPHSDTTAFCAALAKAPPGTITEAERSYLGECP